MRVSVEHDLGDLASDLAAIGPNLYRQGRRVVQQNAAEGGRTARRIAKWTADAHGKLYPRAITWDRSAAAYIGFGGGEISAAYGPDSSLPQGGMSFEGGSRNQPAHNDLANSQDLIRPKFHRDVDHLLDDLFWAGGDR